MMTKTGFVLGVLLALSACSHEDAAKTEQSASAANVSMCFNPQLKQQTRDTLQKVITDNTQQFVQMDHRQFVDMDKIISAFTQLDVQIDEPVVNNSSCQAAVHITLPEHVLKMVKENALILDVAPFDKQMEKAIAANKSLTFNGQTITFMLNYTQMNGLVNVGDHNLIAVANALSDVLLPYGVKDTLIINNQAISREDALNLLRNPKPKDDTKVASEPMMREVSPVKEDIVPPPADLSAIEPQPVEQSNSKIITPIETPQNTISNSELEAAKQANLAADQSIKRAWRNISPDIQKDLVEEQRAWESKKQKSCRNAAAKGENESASRYLQIQCDTRLTREREEYLKGYSID